jgi:hypothetical protein
LGHIERLMNSHVKIARNVLAEIAQFVAEAKPAMSTANGDLFLPDKLPFAAIRLRTSAAEYLDYLAALPVGIQPDVFKIVIVDDLPFHVVINGVVRVDDGGTTLDRKSATIL